MSILARIPLTLVLALCATCELLLNRIGIQLTSSHAAKHPLLFKLMDAGGLFSFYLTGLLALFIFIWATVILIRDPNLFKIPDRIVLTVLSALFLPLAAMGSVLTLPSLVAPHLNTTFGLVLLSLVISFLRRPAPLRARLGVIYLTAPILLHVYWLLTQQVPPLAPGGEYSELPSRLYTTAENMVVVGAFAAFLFFAPFPRLANLLDPLPLVIAVLVTSAVALLASFQYLEMAQATYHGLGLNLPPPSWHGLMHLAALFFFVITVVALAKRPEPQRDTAIGFYLMATSGFHLQLPYQFLLTLIGMIQLIRSSMDAIVAPSPPAARTQHPIEAEQWKTYFSRLATACSLPADSAETMLLQHNGQQIANVRGQRDGLPVSIRVLLEGQRVSRLEVQLGDPPKDPAPIALHRRRGCRGRPVNHRGAGSRVKLQMDDFDRQFSLQDSTETAIGLLAKPQLVSSMERLIHGWLGLWPKEGLRYVAQPPADGWPLPLAEVAFSAQDATTEEIAELVALLSSLARMADV